MFGGFFATLQLLLGTMGLLATPDSGAWGLALVVVAVTVALAVALAFTTRDAIRRSGPHPRRAIDLSSRAVKAGVSTRWKLVLVPADDEDAALRFRLSTVPLTDRGLEPRGSARTIVVENENGRVSDPLFKVFFNDFLRFRGVC